MKTETEKKKVLKELQYKFSGKIWLSNPIDKSYHNTTCDSCRETQFNFREINNKLYLMLIIVPDFQGELRRYKKNRIDVLFGSQITQTRLREYQHIANKA